MSQPQPSSHRATKSKQLASGAIAGILSRTATAPLERWKILRQIGRPANLQTMYRRAGVRGLFRGNLLNVMRVAPYNAIQLTSYDTYKKALGVRPKKDHLERGLCASAAGVTSVVTCYPLDVWRARVTVQNGKSAKSVGQELWREGPRAWYRGLCPSLCGIVTYVGVHFTVFDALKAHYQLPPLMPGFHRRNFMLGAMSSTLALSSMYPLEVVRRRMQNGQAKTVADCVIDLCQTYGPRGLYRGYIPSCIRVVPAMSIAMMTNEALKVYWDF